MIEHVSLRCSDAGESRSFYQRVLEPLGYVCDMDYGDSFGFRDEAGRHDFWVTSGEVGTPTHLAFHAPSREAIERFHAAALEAGGKDNGGPGPRGGYAAYAAFVIDRDGNNVEAVLWEGEPGRTRRRRRAAPAAKRRPRTAAKRQPRTAAKRRSGSVGKGSRRRSARLRSGG